MDIKRIPWTIDSTQLFVINKVFKINTDNNRHFQCGHPLRQSVNKKAPSGALTTFMGHFVGHFKIALSARFVGGTAAIRAVVHLKFTKCVGPS